METTDHSALGGGSAGVIACKAASGDKNLLKTLDVKENGSYLRYRDRIDWNSLIGKSQLI